MIDSQNRERSAAALLSSLSRFADSGTPIVHIRTREPYRAAVILREHFARSENPYHEWSAASGFRRFTTENYADNTSKGDDKDFISAIQAPLEQLRAPQSELRTKPDVLHYFAFLDPGPHITNNPFVLDLIAQYATILPTSNAALIFITHDAPMDMLPQGTVLSAELSTPTADELEEILRRLLSSVEDPESGFDGGHELTDEDIQRICVLGLGMTVTEFEQHVSLAVTSAAHRDETCVTAALVAEGVAAGKTEVIRSSEILELMPTEDIENIGGMQRLKDWISVRSGCYSEEARAAGVEPPKGAVLVGVPGTGKSLVSKAIAAVLGTPLVRLDFGRVFSKYVGESEQRVRAALKMVEEMAPVVLFVDEIDKGLGGATSGGDSGTSLRVLGTYLTWLQEMKAPVFNVVTANRVNGLPPELLRRGRFDQIFSVGLPNGTERKEVLGIHLRRRGYDITGFEASDIAAFVAASDNYVPAEIESAVKDAITTAYSAGEDLTMQHILSALADLIPMFRSHSEQIGAILEWAKNNAIPVSGAEVEEQKEARVPLSRRVGRRGAR